MKIKKMLMIISGRSGSSYLRTLMNQDPRVLMMGEMLAKKNQEEQEKIIRRFFDGKIDEHNSEKNKLVIGFKTKLTDVLNENNFVQQINCNNTVIIINRRKNYLRQAISRARMLVLIDKTRKKYGESHHSPKYKNDVVDKIKVDVDWIYKFTKDFEARDKQLEKLSKKLDNKVEIIFYEDFAYDPVIAVNKLSEILELDLKIENFNATYKNTPANLKEAIINYDELKARLENTKYLPMLYAA